MPDDQTTPPNPVGYRLLTPEEVVQARANLREQNARAMAIARANGSTIHPRVAALLAKREPKP